MAYIKKIFHFYETYRAFEDHLYEKLINPDSIVFIEETHQIYTQGAFFGVSKRDFDYILTTVQNLQEDIENITKISPEGSQLSSLTDVINYLNGFTTSDNLKSILEKIDTGFSREELQEAIDNIDTALSTTSNALSIALTTQSTVDNTLSEYNSLINSLSSSVAEVRNIINNLKNTIGVANGIAPLDNTGKVPSDNLPSYEGDVLEYDSKDSFPTNGESGKIYVDITTNYTYRWSGSHYIETTSSYVRDLKKKVDELTNNPAGGTVDVSKYPIDQVFQYVYYDSFSNDLSLDGSDAVDANKLKKALEDGSIAVVKDSAGNSYPLLEASTIDMFEPEYDEEGSPMMDPETGEVIGEYVPILGSIAFIFNNVYINYYTRDYGRNSHYKAARLAPQIIRIRDYNDDFAELNSSNIIDVTSNFIYYFPSSPLIVMGRNEVQCQVSNVEMLDEIGEDIVISLKDIGVFRINTSTRLSQLSIISLYRHKLKISTSAPPPHPYSDYRSITLDVDTGHYSGPQLECMRVDEIEISNSNYGSFATIKIPIGLTLGEISMLVPHVTATIRSSSDLDGTTFIGTFKGKLHFFSSVFSFEAEEDIVPFLPPSYRTFTINGKFPVDSSGIVYTIPEWSVNSVPGQVYYLWGVGDYFKANNTAPYILDIRTNAKIPLTRIDNGDADTDTEGLIQRYSYLGPYGMMILKAYISDNPPEFVKIPGSSGEFPDNILVTVENPGNVRVVTQEKYDAIESKDDNTLYVIP